MSQRIHSMTPSPRSSGHIRQPSVTPVVQTLVKREEGVDIKPIVVKMEPSSMGPPSLRLPPSSGDNRRARSMSVTARPSKKAASSISDRLRAMCGRYNRSTTMTPLLPISRSFSISRRAPLARRSASIQSNASFSSQTTNGMRFQRPPTLLRLVQPQDQPPFVGAPECEASVRRGDAGEEEEEDSDDGYDDDDDDEDEVIEVEAPSPRPPPTPPIRAAASSGDYATFSLELRCPEIWPGGQTVTFHAHRLQQWHVAGLHIERALKHCQGKIQEKLRDLHHAQ